MTYLNWGPGGLVRCFFHVMGSNLPFQDDEGMLFPDTSDAAAYAESIAKELALNDDQYRGSAVVVVDERENVITRVPIITRTPIGGAR